MKKEMSNEELIDRHADISNDSNDYKTEILSRLEKLESLKCCGNCKQMVADYFCDFHTSIISLPSGYCNKWQSDGMSRQERVIK